MKTRTGYFIKRNGIYYVAWKIKGKSYMKSTGTRDKREAEKRREQIMAPFIVGDEISALKAVAARIEDKQEELDRIEDHQNPPLLISKAWREFFDSAKRPDSGPRTLNGYECHFNSFSKWVTNNHPDIKLMRDISKDLAEEYAAYLLKRKISGNTFNKHMRFMSLLFRVLKDKIKFAENPWSDIQRKRQNSISRRELTVDELRKVTELSQGELRTLLALGIYTGLRLGDCSTLRWGEVDLKRNIIRRIPNKISRRNPKPIIVPIHPVLSAFLNQIPESKRVDYVLPETAKRYNKSSDFVTNAIQKHFESCGIITQRPGTGRGTGKRAIVEVGFHSLRHTFVSLCRESNAPLAVVEAIVGHSNPAMTRHYTHLGEDATISAVGLLPDITANGKKIKLLENNLSISEIRSIIETMNSKNWQKIRKTLLSQLG